jgi:hypothetical protein
MGKMKKKDVVYANNPHDLKAPNRIFVKQFTPFSNMNCIKLPKICLKEFSDVSQQKVDIFNIICDGEYSIN